MAFSSIGMLACHYYWGIFTPYNYLTAKQDILNNKIQIIDTGPPNPLEQKVATSMGFQMIHVSCTKGRPFYNGIKHYNNVMHEAIKQKSGSDWQERFDSTLKSLITESTSQKVMEKK